MLHCVGDKREGEQGDENPVSDQCRAECGSKSGSDREAPAVIIAGIPDSSTPVLSASGSVPIT